MLKLCRARQSVKARFVTQGRRADSEPPCAISLVGSLRNQLGFGIIWNQTYIASAKSVLVRMIAAMNRGGDAAKNFILKAKDIDMFAKPRPKRTRVVKKSLPPLRKNVTAKARRTPQKKNVKTSPR